uniref:Integrase catalytic domain-containing protein n=1 Tax=Panagrolaimus superbus TaxID=310955 RepID=A0A914YMH9_9BILA
MSFKSYVMKDINSQTGFFKNFRSPTFLKTSAGQECAVFINQGLTCTDVIFYYLENGRLEAYFETFLIIFEAISFANKIINLIPQKRYAEAIVEALNFTKKVYLYYDNAKKMYNRDDHYKYFDYSVKKWIVNVKM